MLQKLLKDVWVEHEGSRFQVSPENICILHHWHFGLTKEYYRSKNKYALLPNSEGKVIKVTDISSLLDSMMIAYNNAMENHLD